MVRPVERKGGYAVLKTLVVGTEVVSLNAGGDDEIPEKHGGDEHQVDCPQELWEDHFNCHHQQLPVGVFRSRKVGNCCDQQEQGH